MKKFFLTAISLCLSLTCQAGASSASQPWYFDSIGLTKQVMSLTRQAPIVVSVIDSGIVFKNGLSHAEFSNHSYTKDHSILPDPKAGEALYLHGTAMASLIASNQGVMGIFPNAKIANRKVTPDGISGSWLKAIEDITRDPLLSAGREKIINISGGQKGQTDATSWSDLLSRIGKNNDRLIVAAVGNDGQDMRKVGPDQKIWPAAYSPISKINKQFDPVIRVASLVQYRKGETPRLLTGSLTGSRYGAGKVDIAAPGQNISFLTPEGKIQTGNGTSEATAIVSGVLAAMLSCNPQASAQTLKAALLNNADKYDSLKDKITEGRVLNAGKAIRQFCDQQIHHRRGAVKTEL